MSQTSKIVLGIALVAVIVLGGLYYWYSLRGSASRTPENPEVSTLPSGSDSSDSAIDQDLKAIDAQIQQVGNDNADANQSVNAAVQ